MTTLSAFSAELIRLQEKHAALAAEIKRALDMGIPIEHIRGCMIDDPNTRQAQSAAADAVEALTVTGPVLDQTEGPQDKRGSEPWPTYESGSEPDQPEHYIESLIGTRVHQALEAMGFEALGESDEITVTVRPTGVIVETEEKDDQEGEDDGS